MTNTNGGMVSKRKRTGRVWISYGLFALSAVLFAIVAYTYISDRNTPDSPPPPSAQAGANELKDVVTALRAQGLTVEYGRSADRAPGLSEVAQAITINGDLAYVFIYPDPGQRETEQNRITRDTLVIVNTRSTPVATASPHLYGGSNVLLALMSSDQDVQAKVQRTIEGMN